MSYDLYAVGFFFIVDMIVPWVSIGMNLNQRSRKMLKQDHLGIFVVDTVTLFIWLGVAIDWILQVMKQDCLSNYTGTCIVAFPIGLLTAVEL